MLHHIMAYPPARPSRRLRDNPNCAGGAGGNEEDRPATGGHLPHRQLLFAPDSQVRLLIPWCLAQASPCPPCHVSPLPFCRHRKSSPYLLCKDIVESFLYSCWPPAMLSETASRWRSAVEVIVEHEVEEFINDALINRYLSRSIKGQ
jgi:hypothetical protein